MSEEIVNYTGIVKGIMIEPTDVKPGIRIIDSGTKSKRMGGWKTLMGQS